MRKTTLNKGEESFTTAAATHYTNTVCSNSAVSELLDILREFTNHDLPYYSCFLREAFEAVQPVFMRKRYAEFFWNCSTSVPGYIERVIENSSVGEAEGSVKLFELWRGVDYNKQVANQILRHALDEARHSGIFLRLTNTVFPEFLTGDDIALRKSNLPDTKALQRKDVSDNITRVPEHHLIDHLVQMNIGEIRTRLHMHLFAPILYNLAPDAKRQQVRGWLSGLVNDELRHIAYTALLMEQWAEDGNAKLIGSLYRSRLAIFNHITVDHTESAIKNYGEGRFTDLLVI